MRLPKIALFSVFSLLCNIITIPYLPSTQPESSRYLLYMQVVATYLYIIFFINHADYHIYYNIIQPFNDSIHSPEGATVVQKLELNFWSLLRSVGLCCLSIMIKIYKLVIKSPIWRSVAPDRQIGEKSRISKAKHAAKAYRP